MSDKYKIEIYSLDVVREEIDYIDTITTFKNLSYFNRLNGIGGCTFELAIQDDRANKINLVRYKNIVVVKRYDSIVWFGPITDISGKYSNVTGYVTIRCYTWLYHLVNRYTDKLKNYIGTQQCEIAWDLIDTVQSRTNGYLAISEGNNPTSTTRDRTYEYYSVAQGLMNLSNVINGFDFDFNAVTNSDKQLTGIDFDMYYPYKGIKLENQPPLRLGTNVKSVGFRTKTDLYNSGIAEGSGTGESILSELNYSALQQTYTRREVVKSWKDISVPSTLSTNLSSYLTKESVEGYDIEVELDAKKLPKFGSYSLGDQLKLEITKGSYIYINRWARIQEIAVSVDNQGAEIISPKLEVLG